MTRISDMTPFLGYPAGPLYFPAVKIGSAINYRVPLAITPQAYGALGDGINDDTAAIQAALDSISAFGGGTLAFPHGTYLVSTYLTLPKKVRLVGEGRKASIIKTAAAGGGGANTAENTRNGSVFYSNWPSNASTPADIVVEHLGITCTNGANVGAGFYDNCGTYINLNNLDITGFKYGVIFDQTELSDIDLCDISGQSLAGVWLVNGPDLKAGNSSDFTNRISVKRCQLNEAATTYGILDEGGNAHSFVDNNYNGCLNHIRVAGVTGLNISGGEFESAASACIRFDYQTLLGVSSGSCSAVYLGSGAELIPTAGQSCVSAISLGSIVFDSVFFGNTTAGKFVGTTNTSTIYATNCHNGGGGATFDGKANTGHYEVGSDGTTFAIRSSLPFQSTAPIGYATGAGGAVTQITNKSTAVALNKVCGQITTHAANLAASTSVGFTLTNSTIAATDTVLVSIASGATANSYTVVADAVAAGSCHIHLRNVSAGTLGEALVINFTVIKAVAA